VVVKASAAARTPAVTFEVFFILQVTWCEINQVIDIRVVIFERLSDQFVLRPLFLHVKFRVTPYPGGLSLRCESYVVSDRSGTWAKRDDRYLSQRTRAVSSMPNAADPPPQSWL
jgi:hypothetical protein